MVPSELRSVKVGLHRATHRHIYPRNHRLNDLLGFIGTFSEMRHLIVHLKKLQIKG